MSSPYPSSAPARSRWILERRGARNAVRPDRPHAFFTETERSGSGALESVATIFLTNRECPWKCAMCDLWRNTTEKSVEPGQIPGQIRYALAQLPSARVLKLYNSGSFFDPAAIPKEDWPEIAELCGCFSRLIVECHPRLIDRRLDEFVALLPCPLEIALGLETAHPRALDALNKRITPADYQRAASYLQTGKVDLRTFLLVYPPFVPESEQEMWLQRSIEFAFAAGSAVVSLIPLRGGNGALDEIVAQGLGSWPTLARIEQAQEAGLRVGCSRLFADTWDLEKFAQCPHCFAPRVRRIEQMNLSQRIAEKVSCSQCDPHEALL